MNRLLLAAIVLLCGCAAPAPQSLAETTPAPAQARPPTLDRSCHNNADCTVKDVGNCCGAYPACVNVASPTDPQAVQAQCRASGRMSVCGFRQISACQCVSGRCSEIPAQADTLPRPITPQDTIR